LLLQQDDEPYFSQADFVAPKGVDDYLGMFAVSCFGTDELVAKYKAENDPHREIQVQALADRIVEAFAEAVHKEMRTVSFCLLLLISGGEGGFAMFVLSRLEELLETC
jgi:cobalamin-dependent methionine synthase I